MQKIWLRGLGGTFSDFAKSWLFRPPFLYVYCRVVDRTKLATNVLQLGEVPATLFTSAEALVEAIYKKEGILPRCCYVLALVFMAFQFVYAFL